MDRYSSLDTQKKEIDQEVDHLLNCDESDVTIDVSEKDEEKELNPEQLTTVSTIVSQNDTVNEEKQDGDNLVSFQIGGDDISYKATDISPTVPNNKNNNTFSDNVPMNSQYATVDSVDSVRFAKHATVFTVPRHKHSIKKKNPNQENTLLLRYSVALLFVLILAGFISVRVLHARQTQAILVGRLIHFAEESRRLQLFNQWGDSTLIGWLGLNFTSKFHYCQPNIKEQTIHELCYQSKMSSRMQIIHENKNDFYCYSIQWNASSAERFKDCYSLTDSFWYGMNTGSNQTWPIENFQTDFVSFVPESSDTFGAILEPYWINSVGVTIIANMTHPFKISWNSSGNQMFCLEPEFISLDRNQILHYHICQGQNIKKAHVNAQKIFFPHVFNEVLQNVELLKTVTWSFDQNLENVTFQETVLNFLHNEFNETRNNSLIELTDKWQKSQGDFVFDEKQFPNVSEFLQNVHKKQMSIIYPVSPYFHFTSQDFKTGMMKGYFIKDTPGEVTRLVKWQEKQMAVVDISNPDALKWYSDKLSKVSEMPAFGGLRSLAMGQSYIPCHPHFYNTSYTVQDYIDRMAALYLNTSKILYFDSAINKQHKSFVVNVKPVFSRRDTYVCIDNVVSQVLTVGLLGYPYIALEPANLVNVSQELYMKYIGLASLLPVIRFTYHRHLYNSQMITLVKNMVALHQKLVYKTIVRIYEQIQNGMPIIRPLWWNSPMDLTALKVHDQFLIGDDLMVAPNMCEGQSKRDIYLPHGRWKDLKLNLEIKGGTWLYNYVTHLDFIAIFQLLPNEQR